MRDLTLGELMDMGRRWCLAPDEDNKVLVVFERHPWPFSLSTISNRSKPVLVPEGEDPEEVCSTYNRDSLGLPRQDVEDILSSS